MNYYNKIDKTKFKIDFLVNKSGYFDEKLKNMGSNIFLIEFYNKKDYLYKLSLFFKNNNYDIIHVHTQKYMGDILEVAKKHNIGTRIIHSHSSRSSNLFIKFFQLIRSYKIEKYATNLIACSEQAAKWLFPTKYRECKIVPNAIVFNNYSFDVKKRHEIRKKINIEKKVFLICIVARLSREKDHVFLLKVLKEVNKVNKKIKLMIVGDGPFKKKLEYYIDKKNLNDFVFFVGNVNNVSDYLSASDLFVLCSKREGFGMAVIESQANGLFSIVSTAIPRIANLNLGLFLRLPKKIKLWSKMILEELKTNRTRKAIDIIDTIYNIDSSKNILESIYSKKNN